MRLRRLHWADTAGIIIAGLLIIGSLIALLGPQDIIIFHATGDMSGQQSGVLETTTPTTIRSYAIAALSLGVGLAVFMFWALKTTDDDTSN